MPRGVHKQVAILARAVRDGFLTEGRTARATGVVGRIWWNWCQKEKLPHLTVSQRRKLAEVDLWLIYTDRQLTEHGMTLIAQFLEPLSRSPFGWGQWSAAIDPDGVMVDVAWPDAPAVARALLAIIERPGALERRPSLRELARRAAYGP